MTKIHFVCNGNVFRSRLAEAFMRSKLNSSIEVTSSGVIASEADNGPIGWYAARILKKNSLTGFMSQNWTQTSKKKLATQDLVIFMEKQQLDYVQNILKFKPENFQVWEIPDLSTFGFVSDQLSEKQLLQSIKKSEEIFQMIKSEVNLLIKTSVLKSSPFQH